MKRQFVESYRGYDIWRAGNALNIYKDFYFISRIETLVVRTAEECIDELILREEVVDFEQSNS